MQIEVTTMRQNLSLDPKTIEEENRSVYQIHILAIGITQAIYTYISFSLYYTVLQNHRSMEILVEMKNLKSRYIKSSSTEKHEVIGPKSHVHLIGLNLRGFFPVVFGCSVLDSALLISISVNIIQLFGLKPQAFLLNGTLQQLSLKKLF